MPATVPGTAAGTLRALGRWSLDGPEQRFDASDWWFQKTMVTPPDVDVADAVLGLDGLATLCEVWFNGQLLLSSDSMFVAHEKPLGTLKPGRHLLQLAFRSLDAALATRRGRPRWRAPMIENQHLRWFRTTVLGRTPGWSPPAAAVGPWRPVWISWNRQQGLRGIALRARMEAKSGVVDFTATADGVPAEQMQIRVLHEGRVAGTAEIVRHGASLSARCRVVDPVAWWPHTHGEPALHVVEMVTMDARGRSSSRVLGRIGFRHISLQQGTGHEFKLLINGTGVFCRGACWTPLDVVALQAPADEYRRALTQVKDAGMNMLRISGACVYENQLFFELCDELGIMVWQEFMFANMDFPAQDEHFLARVTQEAQQQLRLWAQHPCIAVICGNSEVSQQAAMYGASREHWEPPLFNEHLRALVSSGCPDVPYWPSSASGGAFPHQVGSGTSSYYGVGAYLRPFDDLRRSGLRFATECLAIANVPEENTLAAVPGGMSLRVNHAAWKRRSPRDLGAGWDFDDVRDFYLRALFGVDPLALRSVDHARYLELSRRVSAEVMEAAFTEWRTTASACGGALVWFLRDLWPGSGWGIVDSTGTAKAPYYALRRVLQPIWLGMTDEGLDGIAVHVANDSATALEGRLTLTAYRGGRTALFSAESSVVIPARSGIMASAARELQEFHDLTFAYRFGPMSTDVLVASLQLEGRGTPLRAIHLTQPGLHSTPDPQTSIKWAPAPAADGAAAILISSNSFVRSIRIDAEMHQADDQYFSLVPGETKIVTLRAAGPAAASPRGFISALNLPGPVRFDLAS
ncbi:MAG: glycoside hydrolase family 2 protein [Pseudomonadota bacterium]|nr:glycoside hydrolase family 2 protein [Pseudomonadota bacterium]